MENQSLPPWAQDLLAYRHSCGMAFYVGLHRPGGHENYREWPVFQLIPGTAVLCCPRCGKRLKLDHCRQIAAIDEKEEERCLNEC